MYYTQLTVTCDPDFVEILMAEVGEAGFDTILEIENGFEAYCQEEQFDAEILNHLKAKYNFVSALSFSFNRIEKKNWNEEWEKNLDPIIVEDQCLVRAHFHKIEKKYPYEIIVTPKMSFGTGHHQTTYLMLKAQMGIDHENKKVMDAGCGTAILSIMAKKRGAQLVEAFDIDEWSVINGNENVANNKCTDINIRQGKISDLEFNSAFDIILANINKNILLAEMEMYSNHLITQGILLVSGFYDHDIEDLKNCAATFSLSEVKRDQKETWASLLLIKA